MHIGAHTLNRAALSHLRIAAPATGLIVGTDRYQQPVPVRFFRPEPTRVSLVGQVWTGQLLAFRALALGARVVVTAAEPDPWHGLGERATGRNDRLVVLRGEQPFNFVATAQQPVLFIYDLGSVGAALPPPLGRWQTQLTILRQLDQPGVPVLQECHLVMLQRLSGAEVSLAATALRLSEQHSQLVRVMADDMLALLGGGTDRYTWLTQTEVEQGAITASRW